MAKQTKEIKGGVGKFIAMTFIGLGLIILGIIFMVAVGPLMISAHNEGAGIFMIYFGLAIIIGPGIALMGVGIPCWIAKGIILKSANKK